MARYWNKFVLALKVCINKVIIKMVVHMCWSYPSPGPGGRLADRSQLNASLDPLHHFVHGLLPDVNPCEWQTSHTEQVRQRLHQAAWGFNCLFKQTQHILSSFTDSKWESAWETVPRTKVSLNDFESLQALCDSQASLALHLKYSSFGCKS